MPKLVLRCGVCCKRIEQIQNNDPLIVMVDSCGWSVYFKVTGFRSNLWGQCKLKKPGNEKLGILRAIQAIHCLVALWLDSSQKLQEAFEAKKWLASVGCMVHCCSLECRGVPLLWCSEISANEFKQLVLDNASLCLVTAGIVVWQHSVAV